MDQPWSQVRQGLQPFYGKVWRDIGLTYGCMALPLVGVALAEQHLGPMAAGLLALPAMVAVGFFFSSLIRFMHEAAHFLLHPTRTANDRLADWFVCDWVFDEVKNYRQVHWQHHLNLGGIRDTEISYFRAPTTRFLLSTLTGAYVFEVLARRVFSVKRSEGAEVVHARRSTGRKLWTVARSGLRHLGLLGLLAWLGGPITALTWVAAMWSTYPFFDVTRQVLEHRRLDVGPEADFAIEAHGPNNRLFGTDVFSRFLGNAGFNLHLLHHWDPHLSYTRLPEMERYFLQTPLRDAIEASRTTYWQTFKALRARAQQASPPGGHPPPRPNPNPGA